MSLYSLSSQTTNFEVLDFRASIHASNSEICDGTCRETLWKKEIGMVFFKAILISLNSEFLVKFGQLF